MKFYLLKWYFGGFSLTHKHRPTEQNRNGLSSTVCIIFILFFIHF